MVKRRHLSARHWLRSMVQHLPVKLRHQYFRSKIELPVVESNSEFTFKLAETKEELEGAFRVLHETYVEEGFSKPHPSGMRITKYHALPSASILIAKWRGAVVGTISILRHTPMGLPIQGIYDLSKTPAPLNRVAEISSLAIDHRFRGHRGELFFPLLKFFFTYCTRYMRLDAMVITVHPKWADFYEGILLFKPIDKKVVENYGFANGNPAIGYYLDLVQVPQILPKIYHGMPKEKNLYDYMMNTEVMEANGSFIFPDRRYYKVVDPVMTPELLKTFFVEKQNIIGELNDEELSVLRCMYPFQSYQGIIPKGKELSPSIRNREPRFQVDCPAQFELNDKHHSMRIVDVSGRGLLANVSVPVSSPIQVKIQVGDFEVAHLKLLPRWTDQRNNIGFEVLAADDTWCRLIYHLHLNYESRNIEEFMHQAKIKLVG